MTQILFVRTGADPRALDAICDRMHADGHECFLAESGRSTLDFLQAFLRLDPHGRLIVVRCTLGGKPGFVATSCFKTNLSVPVEMAFESGELVEAVVAAERSLRDTEPHDIRL